MLDIQPFGKITRHIKRYQQLVSKFSQPKKVKGDYLEAHHFYPKCIFGENSLKVNLPIRAHFLAHEFLWRHYREIKHPLANKLAYPLMRMKGKKNQHPAASTLRITSRMAEVLRRSMHNALIGENNPFYGKKHSQETRDKLSKSLTGKIQSQETKNKIGIGLKEMWDKNPELKKKISERMKNRTVSEETRNRLSKAHTGKILSAEARQKISISNTGKTLGIKKTEEHVGKISAALKGKKKTKEHIDKINRNPEKIRKTAEKHRGMKRSEETKRKISESRLGAKSYNIGTKAYHNPTTAEIIYLQPLEIPPLGYLRGTGRKWKIKI